MTQQKNEKDQSCGSIRKLQNFQNSQFEIKKSDRAKQNSKQEIQQISNVVQHHQTNQKNNEWNQSQIQLLHQYYEIYGNKWKNIASKIPNKSERNVKNYFHSLFRKTIRKLTRFIKENKKQFNYIKEIPPNVINKLLSLSDQKYQTKIQIHKDIQFDLVLSTKQKFLDFIKYHQNWTNFQITEFIKALLQINKLCRKKKAQKKILENLNQCQLAKQKYKKIKLSLLEKNRRQNLWKNEKKVFPKSKTIIQMKNLLYKKDQKLIDSTIKYQVQEKIHAQANQLMQKKLQSIIQEQPNQQIINRMNHFEANTPASFHVFHPLLNFNLQTTFYPNMPSFFPYSIYGSEYYNNNIHP